ncbi:ribosome maturation protein [Myxozyma melibiosi]|uniref:Ribosome maturation protein n=1 Tax=Myxozyma melibiosi TaxID=54550 RepID=A0ABR1F1B8_9ASCO
MSPNASKVFYKGSEDDFLVILSSLDAYSLFRKDPSTTPLVDVVDSFKVFVTHRGGSQGILDQASKAALENEFGTDNVDEAIKQILIKGDPQEGKGYNSKGFDSKNDSNGPAYTGH